ncbi:hypothetical protein B0T25DRAFT_551706 [Lasiosphaeria hispida]|uniref:Uncharacterized protein n=1 Tax=Lasiosphaeria hispida TaxID=260671 RepID=A0AAJ0HB68_9PEZI|nr:hypothetical protein B0T25DRAFT_551706 [Lasiosphaeria hispida]
MEFFVSLLKVFLASLFGPLSLSTVVVCPMCPACACVWLSRAAYLYILFCMIWCMNTSALFFLFDFFLFRFWHLLVLALVTARGFASFDVHC